MSRVGTGLRLLTGVQVVAEDYDTAIEKFWPTQGSPSSALEGRANNTWTDLDGNRILINPANILALVENYDLDAEDDPA